MGVALWMTVGLVASMVVRSIRPARPDGWWAEAIVALLTASLLGVAATALDFGGWNEPDWRAAAFAGAGALAAIACGRIIRLTLPSARASAAAAPRLR